jgi:hypothetical protein
MEFKSILQLNLVLPRHRHDLSLTKGEAKCLSPRLDRFPNALRPVHSWWLDVYPLCTQSVYSRHLLFCVIQLVPEPCKPAKASSGQVLWNGLRTSRGPIGPFRCPPPLHSTQIHILRKYSTSSRAIYHCCPRIPQNSRLISFLSSGKVRGHIILSWRYD